MRSHGISWLAQYPIQLPADYEMTIIRRRVRERGSALDARQGLALKLYGIREVGALGSAVNEYAPFYLWRDAEAMAQFHWGGGGFEGIIRDFGRPDVHTWLPAAIHGSPEAGQSASHFSVTRTVLPPEQNLAAQVSQLIESSRQRFESGEVLCSALGVNPENWQSVTVEIHQFPPAPRPNSQLYTVLHVSAPR